MNAAQVRAKARMAMNRRADEVEQEEIESGEINLIPYLDIVTNLMLFVLVSVAAGFILGEINTTLPNYQKAESVQATDPLKDPEDKGIQLVVSATKQGILLWSVSGREGTLESPKARIARAAATRADGPPHYDYAALNLALYEIASRNWKDKVRPVQTKEVAGGEPEVIRDENYEIILQADPDIPYETIVHILDAVRRRIPPDVQVNQRLPDVTMPKVELEGGRYVAVEPYDPDRHLLFPNVLFGKWSFD
jgi:biopolymer transport protein ExbD